MNLKVTYTAPNRAHHYPVAMRLRRHGCLHAFVSGFSRFSPRSAIPEVGDRLKRVDFAQTLYVLGLRVGLPDAVTDRLNRLSMKRLDDASYRPAVKSDAFVYYRTTGARTCRRLKREQRATLCIMEEVNSHIDQYESILQTEFDQIYPQQSRPKMSDVNERVAAYHEADYILCPSEFVVKSFTDRGFSREKLLKIPYGCSPAGNLDAIPPASATFRVLYVGQINYRKGLRYLIEAFRRLRHPAKELIIVGPRTPFTGLEGTDIPAGVTFTGPLKGEQLEAQYRAATVFVLPSIEEGMALVQGEALARGVPVITTTHSGGEDLFQDGVQGYIVPPFDSAAIADRLQALADDPALRARLAEAALELSRHFAGWDRSVATLVQTLATLTGKGEGAAAEVAAPEGVFPRR